MTLQQAQEADIGDVLIAAYNTPPNFKGGDEVILIGFDNNDPKDMRATFFHLKDKAQYKGNVMDFSFKD